MILAINVGRRHSVDRPRGGGDRHEVASLRTVAGVVYNKRGLPTGVGCGVRCKCVGHCGGRFPDRGHIVEPAARTVLNIVLQVGAKPHEVEARKVQPIPQRAADAPHRACAGLKSRSIGTTVPDPAANFFRIA